MQRKGTKEVRPRCRSAASLAIAAATADRNFAPRRAAAGRTKLKQPTSGEEYKIALGAATRPNTARGINMNINNSEKQNNNKKRGRSGASVSSPPFFKTVASTQAVSNNHNNGRHNNNNNNNNNHVYHGNGRKMMMNLHHHHDNYHLKNNNYNNHHRSSGYRGEEQGDPYNSNYGKRRRNNMNGGYSYAYNLNNFNVGGGSSRAARQRGEHSNPVIGNNSTSMEVERNCSRSRSKNNRRANTHVHTHAHTHTIQLDDWGRRATTNNTFSPPPSNMNTNINTNANNHRSRGASSSQSIHSTAAGVGAGEANKQEQHGGDDNRSASNSSVHDDSVGHYRGKRGDIIANRYELVRDVGLGTFGRVVECLDLQSSKSQREADNNNATTAATVVAIKIVRDVKRYNESARIEADIVGDVNTHYDPKRQSRGTRLFAEMFSCFDFQGHYCLVFECLGQSLYDYLKVNNYKPFPIDVTRHISQQLLNACDFLHTMKPYPLIHTDLKLENVLMVLDHGSNNNGSSFPNGRCDIKVIDFGGATYDNEKKSSIINTRQYRAPEVILQHEDQWSTPSDMWSAACIIMELHQGELLFATHDNTEHLGLIQRVCSSSSSNKNRRKHNGDVYQDNFAMLKRCHLEEGMERLFDFDATNNNSKGKFIGYCQLSRSSAKHVESVGSVYDLVMNQEEKVCNSNFRQRGSRGRRENKQKLLDLVDLVESLLEIDPRRRATAKESLKSNFISNY